MSTTITPLATPWLFLDRTRGQFAQQLPHAIRDLILDGRLRPGERLPSSRALAQSLGIDRSTVVAGYDRLRAEGFVAGKPGSAVRVVDLPTAPQGARPEASVSGKAKASPSAHAREPERFLPFSARLARP